VKLQDGSVYELKDEYVRKQIEILLGKRENTANEQNKDAKFSK